MSETDNPAGWAAPSFSFTLDWGRATHIPFREVRGLDVEPQANAIREGESPVFSVIKQPGAENSGTVTLEHGLLPEGDVYQDWYEGLKAETITRQEVVIRLLGMGEGAIMTWTLHNAWPGRVVVAEPGGGEGGVAIDRLEIVHEGITISGPEPG